MIGYPELPKDVLDEFERRVLLVKKLRMLAVEAKGLTASLPTLPVCTRGPRLGSWTI